MSQKCIKLTFMRALKDISRGSRISPYDHIYGSYEFGYMYMQEAALDCMRDVIAIDYRARICWFVQSFVRSRDFKYVNW